MTLEGFEAVIWTGSVLDRMLQQVPQPEEKEKKENEAGGKAAQPPSISCYHNY